MEVAGPESGTISGSTETCGSAEYFDPRLVAETAQLTEFPILPVLTFRITGVF